MSKNYWEKRAAEKLTLIEAMESKNLNRIKSTIRQIKNNIDLEIRDLYIKYAEDNKMSYSTALKYLNNNELKEFKMSLDEYIETAKDDFKRSKYRQELQAISTRARVSRLEALRANIIKEVAGLEAILLDQEKFFKDTYNESYNLDYYAFEQFKGFKLRFDKPNTNKIKVLTEYPWSGKNYSQKVWGNTDALINNLDSVITAGLIQGKNIKELSKSLDIAMYGNNGNKGTLYNCERLVRTENAFIVEEATADAYSSIGVEEYEISATLDTKTSKICQGQDGKVYKLKDKKVGVNYPPFHVFCRTTTLPVVKWDDEESIPQKRIAKDENGNTMYVDKMPYNEWKEKYLEAPEVKVSKNRDKKVDKHSNENDIIKEIRKDIKDGKYNLNLNKQAYEKHVEGHKRFEDYVERVKSRGLNTKPSSITISYDEVQELIKKYAGTGKISAVRGQVKEIIVDNEKIVGIYRDINGNESETNEFIIHYSTSKKNKGCHIVPSERSKK